MNVAVCDDIAQARNLLICHLRRFMLEQKIEIAIREYESGEALLAACARGEAPDILFLDIYYERYKRYGGGEAAV